MAAANAWVAAVELDLRFEAREDVTTVPALAVGGDPSTVVVKLLRGENELPVMSDSAPLPRFPRKLHVHNFIQVMELQKF